MEEIGVTSLRGVCICSTTIVPWQITATPHWGIAGRLRKALNFFQKLTMFS